MLSTIETACPVFTSLAEANAYRQQITTALCEAAAVGDCASVEALQARSAALPLLIVGLVGRQVQEFVATWEGGLTIIGTSFLSVRFRSNDCQTPEAALARAQEGQQSAYQQEQTAWADYKKVEGTILLGSTDHTFHTAERASIASTAAGETVRKLQSGLMAAQSLRTQMQEALTLTVHNPNAGLVATDKVLTALEGQRTTFRILAPKPAPVFTAPAFLSGS